MLVLGLEPDPRGGDICPPDPQGPTGLARASLLASLLFQKDPPQPSWALASAEGPQPLRDPEATQCQQQQPSELAEPEDVAGLSPQDPTSPAHCAPEPTGLPGASA